MSEYFSIMEHTNTTHSGSSLRITIMLQRRVAFMVEAKHVDSVHAFGKDFLFTRINSHWEAERREKSFIKA